MFTVPNSGGKEVFEVNNYDDLYYGTSDLTTATLHSDNSIFAELGFRRPGPRPQEARRRSPRRPSGWESTPRASTPTTP